MVSDGYERMGKPNLPRWWWDQFLSRLEKTEKNYAELAREASDHAGRESKWTASAVTKFKKREAMTWELAMGLSKALGIQPPMYVARTEIEAGRLGNVAREFDNPPTEIAPARPYRVEAAVRRLEQAAAEKTDQTKLLPSEHEGSDRGRRTGRPARRR